MNNFETKSNLTEKLLMTYINYVAWECWSNRDMELHDPEESMVIRKILAHDIRMKKNPQTKDETFWINADVESHDAEESMAIRTILAHDIRMKKKSTNQGVDFLDCGFL